MAKLEPSTPEAAAPQVPLRVEVVSVQPFEVVALRNRGAFAGLDQAYGELFEWAAGAGLIESIIGLHGVPLGDHREVPQDDLEFECAIRLSGNCEPVAPLRSITLGGGEYARIHHVGAYEGLEDLLDQVLAEWLPESGFVLRDVPVHYDFLDDPEQVPEAMLRADLFLPVIAAADNADSPNE